MVLYGPTVTCYFGRPTQGAHTTMKVILPVAGSGTRLRPHTFSLPKPLLPVAGKPILGHILDPLSRLDNIDEVIFVIGAMGDKIVEWVNNTYSFRATFVEQTDLLGLGFALNLAMPHVDEGELLIVLGDTIVDVDYRSFIGAGTNVLGVRQVDDPTRFGIVEVADNRITGMVEKPENPPTDLAIIGLYYFQDGIAVKDALAAHVATGTTTRGEIQFTDALQRMIADGHEIVPYAVDKWYDCGKPETMLATNRHLLTQMESPEVPGSNQIIPPVFLGKDVVIDRCVIGPNVSIGDRTHLSNCVIEDTIVGDEADIRDSVLVESLIGHRVRLQGEARRVNLGETTEIMSFDRRQPE